MKINKKIHLYGLLFLDVLIVVWLIALLFLPDILHFLFTFHLVEFELSLIIRPTTD